MNWDDELHVGLLRKAYARDLDTLTIRQHRALQRYARDVFTAGRTEGEKARHAAPAKPRVGVESRRRRLFWLAIQLLASATTLLGMALGSTTYYGAAWYLGSAGVWIWLSIEQRLWGLMPLNVIALAIEIVNFSRASG
jgi:hypothetical protein